MLLVVLHPVGRVSAVDNSSKCAMCALLEPPVVLYHPGLSAHGAMKAQAAYLCLHRVNKMSFDFPDHSDIDPEDPAASFKS